MSDRPLTLMAVHAHPDDEATGTGGVFARYAAEGMQTILVTCTDGACGDGPGGAKPGEPGHDPAAVVALRTTELRRSCELLNVTHLELLGYADSGMMGWATNDAPDAFWNTPVDAAAARLAELLVRYQPDVVVTYDKNGFYGHPDHIQANRVTMAAVASTDVVSKVYWTTAPRERMQQIRQLVRDAGGDWDDPEPDPNKPPPVDIGLPTDEISTFVDSRAFTEQKFEALAAHASQSENIFFLRLGKEAFGDILGVETFLRVQDNTNAPLPENDLFAGLR